MLTVQLTWNTLSEPTIWGACEHGLTPHTQYIPTCAATLAESYHSDVVASYVNPASKNSTPRAPPKRNLWVQVTTYRTPFGLKCSWKPKDINSARTYLNRTTRAPSSLRITVGLLLDQNPDTLTSDISG